ncbi:hypothetical protein ACJ41O_003430 [Fusarium nematophilum]
MKPMVMNFIEGRESDDRVTLTEEDLESLEDTMGPTVGDEKPSRERIILKNVAKFQATQINAPLGKDIWENVDRLVVRNNQADALSTQINYPMTLGAFYSGVIPQLAFFVFVSFLLYFPVTYYFHID